VTGRWVSPGTPVSSINKTDRHDITDILLKVVLNTINQPILDKYTSKKDKKEEMQMSTLLQCLHTGI